MQAPPWVQRMCPEQHMSVPVFFLARNFLQICCKTYWVSNCSKLHFMAFRRVELEEMDMEVTMGRQNWKWTCSL